MNLRLGPEAHVLSHSTRRSATELNLQPLIVFKNKLRLVGHLREQRYWLLGQIAAAQYPEPCGGGREK